jgi:hypothetical protein
MIRQIGRVREFPGRGIQADMVTSDQTNRFPTMIVIAGGLVSELRPNGDWDGSIGGRDSRRTQTMPASKEDP